MNCTAELVARQFREAMGDVPCVTCPCGLNAPVRFLFRCLYCGVWFCQRCAEEHFGESRIAHNKRLSAKQAGEV